VFPLRLGFYLQKILINQPYAAIPFHSLALSPAGTHRAADTIACLVDRGCLIFLSYGFRFFSQPYLFNVLQQPSETAGLGRIRVCRVSWLVPLQHSRQIPASRTARIIHIERNLLWTLGCKFIEPFDELGIAATITNEAG
jgi:hypothetical protein